MFNTIKKWYADKKINILVLSPPQIIILGFFSLIVLGSVLLVMPFAAKNGHSVGFINAFFTATSATCVTGLVVLDTATTWSGFGKTVIIILIQIGGLGIMSMATLLSFIMRRRLGLKERLTIQESINEFNLQGIVKLLKYILTATFIIELAGAVILSFRFIPLYGFKSGIAKSLFHSVSAFCNAGFDIMGTKGNEFSSLTQFTNEPLIVLTIAFLFILGGLGFIVWRDVIYTKKFSKFMLHTKVVLISSGFFIVFGTIILLISEYNNPQTIGSMPFFNKLLNSFFQAVTPRTAGFNTISCNDMNNSSKLITMILMFIGAAPGSTGGGIKVTTFIILIFSVTAFLRGKEDINIIKRKVPENMVKKSLAIVGFALMLIFITSFILMFNSTGEFSDCVFEAISAFGTVGLSTGITPSLNIFGKIIVIITMFIGRVGPISIALSLSSLKNGKIAYKYPEGKITVG